MDYEVRLAESATADLFDIKVFIAHAAGVEIAEAYESGLRAACLGLAAFPRRGTPRDDLAPGLRSIAVRRRATIFYMVDGDMVRIVRILQRGRDSRREFGTR